MGPGMRLLPRPLPFIASSIVESAFSLSRARRHLACSSSPLPAAASCGNMHSSPPAWLQRHLDDTRPPPKLLAWTAANLDGAGPDAGDCGQGGDDLDRRIFILGVGNIGRLYASHLARHPAAIRPPVTLVVHRRELLSQWAASGGIELVVPGAGGHTVRRKDGFDVEWWAEAAPTRGPVREVVDGRKLRNLVIATKADAAVPEADRLRRYLDAESSVAFAQNGVCKLWPPHGPAYVAHRYPDAGSAPSFLACVTSHGLYSLGPFRSVHAAAAEVSVGLVPVYSGRRPLASAAAPSPASAAYLMRQIATAPQLQGKTVSSPELWLLQLEKLVYNSSINPLTALLRCKNGGLFEEPDGVVARVMDRLLGETSCLLQAMLVQESFAQILVANGSSEHREQQQQQLRARFSQPRLREMLHAFGAKVAGNTSSMLQDVQAGKPTEVRDFNGWLVDAAASVDSTLDMSAHQAIVDLVEAGTVLTKEELSRRFLS